MDPFILEACQLLPRCFLCLSHQTHGKPKLKTVISHMSSDTAASPETVAQTGTSYEDFLFYARELIIPILFLAMLSPSCLSMISFPTCSGLIVSLISLPRLARRISPYLMSTSMLDALNIRAGATLSLCAGITALILQNHSPQIAFAVHRHSGLHARPLARLLRTFLFVELALNGTAREKVQIASWLRWIHRGVYGSLPLKLQNPLDTEGANTSYGYTEELKAYVLQTLTWSTIEFCNRFGKRLDERGQDHIVLQYTCIGYHLGIPASHLARDFATFSTQFKTRLQSIPVLHHHATGGDLRQETFAALEYTTLAAGNSWTRLLSRCAFLIGHELLPVEVKRSYRPRMLNSWMMRFTQHLLLFVLWFVYPSLVWLPIRGVIALFCILEPAVRNTVESSLHTIHCMDVTSDKPLLRPMHAEPKEIAIPAYVQWLSSGNEVTTGQPPLLQLFLCRFLAIQTSGKRRFRDSVSLFAVTFVDVLRVLLCGVTVWMSKRRAEIVLGRIAASLRKHNSSHPSLPHHVGCIMDGNRRYARSRHAAVAVGHAQGALVAVRLLGWWIDSLAYFPAGPRVLTLWAFSSDNFKRSPDEVQTLFRLMTSEFRALAFSSVVHLARMRVHVIGSRTQFPNELIHAIELLENRTAIYDELHLQLAVGYGGREEVVDSVGRVLSRGERVTESAISRETYCARSGLPPVDLILRTSERRTSGFLLWDTQTAELHFIDKLWPELNQLDWLWALETSAQREQRYGT